MHAARVYSLLAPLLAAVVSASPYPKDNLRDFGFGWLMPRACASYCGSDNQWCCQSNEQCITTTGRATCTAGGGNGGFAFYTTTWTETRTYTSTFSSYYPGATTPAGGGTGGQPCVPPAGSGQVACGPICCANWQYCADNVKGQCMPNPGAGSWTYGTTVGVVTTAFSAPFRVTSGSTMIMTQPTATMTSTGTGTIDNAAATSTAAQTPGTTTSNNQLSGGAIAGIVVGTIAGVIILLLICFCCIVRGLWLTLMNLLGLRKKRETKERVEITEERYSRHGSAHGRRSNHGAWYTGGRPSGVGSRKEKKESGGWGSIGWLAAAGGAALLLLGLRQGDKKKTNNSRPPRSDYGSTYYSGSYTATSASSASSDRRTRDTRRSRNSRATRASRHTRRS